MSVLKLNHRPSALLQAGEALSQFDIVYGNSVTGKVLKAQNDNTEAEANAIGIVTQAGGISNNGYGTVVFYGLVTNPAWNLTPLADVYLGATYGGITQEKPSTGYIKPIGFAVSATSIYFNFAQPAWDSALDAAPSPMIVMDTQTNRPDAGTQGREFIPTNGYGPTRQIDNGSSWDNYYNGFKCSNPPAASSFTKVGTDAQDTLTDDGDGLLLVSTGKNSGSLFSSLFLLSLPAAPYSFIVGMTGYLCPVNACTVGIVLTNGTGTSDDYVGLVRTAATNGIPYLDTPKFSALNTFSASYTNRQFEANPLFIKIEDNNTNRIYSFSFDGRDWIVFYTVSRTDFLTPTHAGLKVQQATNAISIGDIAVKYKIFHWSLG